MAAISAIQEKRSELGLTRHELAVVTGLSDTTIYRVETNSNHGINDQTARALSQALGVEVIDLGVQNVSHLGRPPQTGRPLQQGQPDGNICVHCHLETNPHIHVCGNCDEGWRG